MEDNIEPTTSDIATIIKTEPAVEMDTTHVTVNEMEIKREPTFEVPALENVADTSRKKVSDENVSNQEPTFEVRALEIVPDTLSKEVLGEPLTSSPIRQEVVQSFSVDVKVEPEVIATFDVSSSSEAEDLDAILEEHNKVISAIMETQLETFRKICKSLEAVKAVPITKYYCHTCDKELKSQQGCSLHSRIHRNTSVGAVLEAEIGGGITFNMTFTSVNQTLSLFCFECATFFRSAKKLNIHERARSHECYICKKRFDRCRYLKLHRSEQRLCACFECVCGANFELISLYEQHKLTCAKAKADRSILQSGGKRCKVCKKCECACSNKASKYGDEVKTKVNHCHLCNRQLRTQYSYSQHMTRYHLVTVDRHNKFCKNCKDYVPKKTCHDCPLATKRILCDHCPRRFLTTDLYRQHLRDMRDPTDCAKCKQQFKPACSISAHEDVCGTEYLLYVCQVCGFTFLTSALINSHLMTVHMRPDHDLLPYIKTILVNPINDEAEKEEANHKASESDTDIAIVDQEQPETITLDSDTDSSDDNDADDKGESDQEANSEASDTLVIDERGNLLKNVSKTQPDNEPSNVMVDIEEALPADVIVKVEDDIKMEIKQEDEYDQFTEDYEDDLIVLDDQTYVPAESIVKTEAKVETPSKNDLCPHCGASMSVKSLKEHVAKKVCQTNAFTWRFYCSTCGHTAKTIIAYLQHWQNHLNLKSTCIQCFKFFRNNTSLFAHAKRHASTHFESGVCTECNANIGESVPSMLLHWEGHYLYESRFKFGGDVPGDVKPVIKSEVVVEDLTVCAKLLMEIRKRKKCHGSKKVCPNCGKEFFRWNAFKVHLSVHLLEEARERARTNLETKLRCCFCGELFDTVGKLKPHIRCHSLESQYQCRLCPKSFSCSSNLAKHKKVHGINIMQCDLCKRKFNKKRRLIEHMARHQSLEKIQCKMCPRQFHFPSEYKKHLRVLHCKPDTPKFKCTLCLASFASQKVKWEHEFNVHRLSTRYYACSFCNLKTRLVSTLRKHLMVYHNEKVTLKALQRR